VKPQNVEVVKAPTRKWAASRKRMQE